MNRNKIRRYVESQEEILQILTADDSEDESDKELDEEDQRFLAIDGDKMGEEIEIVGENVQEDESEVNRNSPPNKKHKENEGQLSFRWKRKFDPIDIKHINYPFCKIKLLFDNNKYDPMDIFQRTCNFDKLITDIVEQSELYMHQRGVQFSTNTAELNAFIGMIYVMGYHKLPSIRDYWSTDPSCHVPFISNIMPRNRFELILSSLHFANNNEMLEKSNQMYDRAFKVRPIINHFNDSFQAAREPSKHQSIDEHMVKFKGHNAMKQYIKTKPIKWGFKMWCRCDSKTGY